MNNEIENFTPSNQEEWRKWLELNHKEKEAVWLVIHKKGSSNENLTWSEAVDEALCFGWIDSLKKPINSEKYKQYFGPRKPRSTWSKINKEKIESLIDSGLMTEAGLKPIEIAKQNGSWTILDSAENLEIPFELEQEFKRYPEAKEYFLGLSRSIRKSMLHRIALAKRPDTRQKRIADIINSARMK